MTPYKPKTQTDSVIDVSHYQGRPDWPVVKGSNNGLKAVIAKATQGIHVDPAWDWNARSIGPTGLLPGAYHFCNGDDAVAQVDAFLKTVAPVNGILIALDWEPAGNSSLEIVEAMVQEIEQRLGRLPVMYLGRYQIAETSKILSACDLWLPEYGNNPICPPGWTSWRLHQHTDGSLGDNTGPIAGIGRVDRSYYDETQGEMTSWWGQPKGEIRT